MKGDLDYACDLESLTRADREENNRASDEYRAFAALEKEDDIYELIMRERVTRIHLKQRKLRSRQSATTKQELLYY